MLIPDAVKPALRSTLCGTGIAVSAVIIGLLGSLFHEKILSAWPFPLLEGPVESWGGVVPEAAWFWGLILVFALVFTAREAVRSADREEIRLGFDEQLKKVIYVTEYTPPRAFYSQYDEYYKESVRTADNAIEFAQSKAHTSTADPLTEPIRLVLDFILQLARLWDLTAADKSVSDRVYRSNVMWFVPRQGIDELGWSNVYAACDKLYSYESEESLKKELDALLLVDLEMSTKERSDGGTDDEIDELYLLCFLDQSKSNKNLPGGPYAAVERRMNYIGDTSEIARIAKKNGSFSTEELKKIRKYYKNDDKGRSIVSLPILFKYDRDVSRPPIGVLNIYRDQPSIMRTEGRAEQFARIVTPFVNLVRRLMIERQRFAKRKKSGEESS